MKRQKLNILGSQGVSILYFIKFAPQKSALAGQRTKQTRQMYRLVIESLESP